MIEEKTATLMLLLYTKVRTKFNTINESIVHYKINTYTVVWTHRQSTCDFIRNEVIIRLGARVVTKT